MFGAPAQIQVEIPTIGLDGSVEPRLGIFGTEMPKPMVAVPSGATVQRNGSHAAAAPQGDEREDG